MLRSGALRSTDSELVQACIKGLTSLFALHNNRLAVRADARIQSKERQAMKEINDIMPDGGYFTKSHYSSSCSSLCSNFYFSFYFTSTCTTSHLLTFIYFKRQNKNLDKHSTHLTCRQKPYLSLSFWSFLLFLPSILRRYYTGGNKG